MILKYIFVVVFSGIILFEITHIMLAIKDDYRVIKYIKNKRKKNIYKKIIKT